MSFSDFLYYISQNEEFPFNCSLFYLPQGNLSFEVSGEDVMETVDKSFLSAYYISNCSLEEVYNYVKSANNSNVSTSTLEMLYTNKRDDGDSYVALLFVSSGSCVTAWMLSLLLYLSPKHKQKPILVYAATICYSIAATIFLDTLTKDSSSEYYSNSLDILRIRNTIGNNVAFMVFNIISQILFDLSWLQLIVHMTKQRFKLLQVVIFGTLVIVYIPWNIIYLADFENLSANYIPSFSHKWKLVTYIFRIVITIYFTLCLLYFTLIMKNPKKISFIKSLIPIGLFSLLIICLEFVVIILQMSIYKTQWLTNIWLSIFPQVFQAISLTTIWEWFFDMQLLEKKRELQGVLGRRLSRDDLLQSKSKGSGKRGLRLFDALLLAGNRENDAKSITSGTEEITLQDLSNRSLNKSSTNENNIQGESQVETSLELQQDNNLGQDILQSRGTTAQEGPSASSSSQQSCEIQYINDYDFSSDSGENDSGDNNHEYNFNSNSEIMQESNSHVHDVHGDPLPPPFVPLPGFSIDDYEDEKSHNLHINEVREGSGIFLDK